MSLTNIILIAVGVAVALLNALYGSVAAVRIARTFARVTPMRAVGAGALVLVAAAVAIATAHRSSNATCQPHLDASSNARSC
jgi:hypothetical protein